MRFNKSFKTKRYESTKKKKKKVNKLLSARDYALPTHYIFPVKYILLSLLEQYCNNENTTEEILQKKYRSKKHKV